MAGDARATAAEHVSWLIRGVQVPGYGEPGERTAILTEGGSITAIGPGVEHPDARVLDADGLVALPGLVDLHTHLREPGREDAETVQTGTAAAALGGDTPGDALANTDPGADTAGGVGASPRPRPPPGGAGGPPGGGPPAAPPRWRAA